MRIATLDIGGTSIKSGIWNGIEIIEFKETNTCASQGGPALMERAIDILKSYQHFEGIGISTAGQVNWQQGSIHYANDNIPAYTGVEVKKIMEQAFGVPVTVENDVNAAAIGEGHFGAAAGIDDFLCLTYGTGVGGAIVLNGEVYRGACYSAGSFGGILIHPEDYDPNVEFSGCYEKYASATGLVRKVSALYPELTNGKLIFNNIDHAEVRQAIDEWIEEIIWGLVSLVHIFNPKCIVLGGGVMAQPYVLEQVKKRLCFYLSPGFRDANVLSAGLGNHAGMIGAAYQVSGLI